MDFYQPLCINEVKDLLVQSKFNKLLAGGTDLVLDIKRGKINPEVIIDINRIEALKDIREDHHEISIGSMVCFSQLKDNSLMNQYFHSIVLSASHMGSPQIRNMATIGGNIINKASAADIIPCLISLNAVLVLESKDSIRYINLETYFQNEDWIRKDEILTKIIISKKNVLSGYNKLGKRNSLAIARINVAVSFMIEDKIIKHMSICLGAVGRYPFRVKELEEKAIGKTVDYLFSEEPLEILEQQVYKSIKGRSSMPFKKEAIKGVYKNAVMSSGVMK